MNRSFDTVPTSDAQLFDMLHSLFGIGNFDEQSEQWFRFRINETAKLRAIRGRRGISLADFAMTARYCRRQRLMISDSWQVCGHIADAKREARRIGVPELSREVAEAIASERALPGPEADQWVERLLLARGPARREVIDQWKRTRNLEERGSANV